MNSPCAEQYTNRARFAAAVGIPRFRFDDRQAARFGGTFAAMKIPATPKGALAASAALMLVIAYNDAIVPAQVSLWPLYILPVGLVSWRCGFLEGGLCAASAGLLLLVSARFGGHPYTDTGFLLFATAGHVAALLVIAWCMSRLAATESLLLKLLSKLS